MSRRSLVPHPDMPGAFLLPLTRDLSAIIDAADVDAVSAHSWCAQKGAPNNLTYARGWVDGRHVYLHRFLWRAWGLPEPQALDHINGDPFDNRRVNLRACTAAQNNRNSGRRKHTRSGYKGAYKHGRNWQAQIYVDGKTRHLGMYETPQEAHAAYVAAAQRIAGEFARAA